ncbi:MAG: hypothetical protein ACRD01_00530 [Terriglobales bacterium]
MPGFALLAAAGFAAAQAPAGALAAQGLAALGAGPQAGYIASGTATLTTARGARRGAITVAAWGADRCRVTVDIAGGGRFELIANGSGLHWRGPAAWAALAPTGGRFAGCALVPQGLLWADLAAGTASASAGAAATLVIRGGAQTARALTLTLDASSGLPTAAAWTWRGHAVTLSYRGYTVAGGVSYPASVTMTDGSRTLVVAFTSFAVHAGFTDADFPAAPPRAATRPGGQP